MPDRIDRTRPCQRCGTEIPAERVEILPQTRLCVACSKTVGGEFDLTVIPENLAKSGSMKRNYGSWEVRQTRKPLPVVRSRRADS